MATIINMLKLFFIITTLTMLVKSETTVEWICEEMNQRGNCSSLPQLPKFLAILNNDTDIFEYSEDIDYCPFNIVSRSAKCIHSFYRSCHMQMNFEERSFFANNMPLIMNTETLCAEDRAYKKEYLEHNACLKDLEKINYQYEAPLNQYLEHGNLENGLKKLQGQDNGQIKDLHYWREESFEKCRFVTEFFRFRFMLIREACGVRTEKFLRLLLSNIWPISTMLRNCNKNT